jgi:hypothetical protein
MLIEIITSSDPTTRNRSLDTFCRSATTAQLLHECGALDQLRRTSANLYERVRACFFLYAIYRFYLPGRPEIAVSGRVPYVGFVHLLNRRFEQAITVFLAAHQTQPSETIASALATAYHQLAFQTLADQVRRSVRSVRGNQWMFRVGHPLDQPLRLRDELRTMQSNGLFPVLHEATPVRMDLSHSGWSDIFFLGMDYPEGARVLNVSIDLGVRGRDAGTRPPVEAYLRVIDTPVLRLTSVDLGATVDITELSTVFDFAKDYLGLLKAAVIAAGLVPPGIEGAGQPLADLLARLVGPGRGLELVSVVNDIPKGSRLAVSTNLLAALISVCMRATRQTAALTGALAEHERRLVAARAILGEWLAGSGGGWQDSGGVWPGMKLIEGVQANADDPEFGISRGCLLPRHRILDLNDASAETRQSLQESLVLVHGGMAQNVGPILEMVTEKYLLRSPAEWEARQNAGAILDQILAALRSGDIRAVGAATTRNFFGPLQTIIPWASNRYTESLIEQAQATFADDLWGFWMLGGMSGGGMGFIFDPQRTNAAKDWLQETMLTTKRQLEHALPFAMEPVVYNFTINERGTWANLLRGDEALLPSSYYALVAPSLLRTDPRTLTPGRRVELERFGVAIRQRPELSRVVQTLVDSMLPATTARRSDQGGQTLDELLDELGFDRLQHEQIRADLRAGRIGLAQNRLPPSTTITDVTAADVVDATQALPEQLYTRGAQAIADQQVAVVTLAAGAGSRWTQGAGTVKALHPFARLGGKHRTFIETHLAKSRQVGRQFGASVPHIVTTSYLTHAPIEAFLNYERRGNGQPYGYEGPLLLSPGRAVGLRFVPMARDLRFAWEELAQQRLDEQAQKMRDSAHAALIGWVQSAGEGSDYTDNLALQCLHPVGHWFEIANLLRNGVLAGLLAERPQLQYLMLHNIDTLGANLDPALLGLHIERAACLSFEVIPRRIEDHGGGLARVDGQPRLVEGLAMPREPDEFQLSYYNTLTCWITIDRLLAIFGLVRTDLLQHPERVAAAIRRLAARIPTYVTLKDVKKRWGHGQEDIFPVAQFEKLWGDMSALPDVASAFVVVPRLRGQQLKDQAQLDGWLRDGSAAYVEQLCAWE